MRGGAAIVSNLDFVHARTFETCWGQALAFLDHDDAYDTEILTLRVWAPIAHDGDLAIIDMKIGLQGDISDTAVDAMESANRSALADMDAGKFEAALRSAGMGGTLDRAFEARVQ